LHVFQSPPVDSRDYNLEKLLRVYLLTHTPEPEKIIAMAAKLCYSSSNIGDLSSLVESSRQEKFLKKIIGLGHLSVLEHACFTFGVEGISRATSHQLVRHRVASYSQQSQRYVKSGDDFEYVTPPTISESDKLSKKYRSTVEKIHSVYRELVIAGIPAEDARFLLPNAAATKIIITMNARELLHFFTLRCCERAQWEIRDMACAMLKLAREVVPSVFDSSGPGCVRGKCTEGEMTCGRPEEIREKIKNL